MTTLSPDTLKATEQAIKPLWQYLLALGAEPDHLALLTQARALATIPKRGVSAARSFTSKESFVSYIAAG